MVRSFSPPAPRSTQAIRLAVLIAALALSFPRTTHAFSATHRMPAYAPGPLGAQLKPFPALRMLRRTSLSTRGVDLRSLAPPVGDQGELPSCVSWVVSEYRYALARRDGLDPGPFAPMYLYAQLVRGFPFGTTLDQNLQILAEQGIEPAADYSFGVTNSLYDDTDQPTAEDRARALHYRLPRYAWRYPPYADEGTIDTWMSQQHLPIVILLSDVYQNFDFAGHTDSTGTAYPLLIPPPSPGMAYRGSHVVMGYRTDAQGVWFLNTWGAGYGEEGWAELSWAAIAADGYVYVLQQQARIPSTPCLSHSLTRQRIAIGSSTKSLIVTTRRGVC